MAKRIVRGFTLIEILVVMGILAVLGSLGLMLSFDSYRQYLFQNDRDLIVASLQKARSQAVNNICLGTACTGGLPHGVHIVSGTGGVYTIFQGSTYSSGDTINEAVAASPNTNVTVSGGSSDVIFTQLSATTTPATITVTEMGSHTSTISITDEGSISWTN